MMHAAAETLGMEKAIWKRREGDRQGLTQEEDGEFRKRDQPPSLRCERKVTEGSMRKSIAGKEPQKSLIPATFSCC